MWIDLYLLAAVVMAGSAWLVSPRFQSYDPPADVVRAFWSIIAGALWPLVLVGVAQLLAVRFVARRLQPTPADDRDLLPVLASQDVTVGS